MKRFQTFAIAAVFMLLLSGMVAAQPGTFPQAFYGTVTINGAPAPDGTLVAAKFEGSDVEGGLTSGGKYGPDFVVALEEADLGKTIEFYVQNVKAAEAPYNDSSPKTLLDLSVTIAAPPVITGNTGSTGSSGGSTGGSSVGSGTCTESWICTDWLDCTNSVQKRVCADVNRCNTTLSKPVEQQSCTVPKVCEPGSTKCENGIVSTCSGLGTTWLQSQICEAGCDGNVCKQALTESAPAAQGGNPLTGMLTLQESWPYWVVIIVVIVILAWFFLIRKKPAAAPKK